MTLFAWCHTVLHSVCSMPLKSLSSLAISLCGTAAVCVMSFTAVFYEFVQLSQVILPSASGTLPLSASLWCGGLILHGGLLKQTQSPNSRNMQKLSADQSLLVLNIKDFQLCFFWCFFFLWCFDPVNLCVFVCEFICQCQNCIKDIF